jgi:hypothetical protein
MAAPAKTSRPRAKPKAAADGDVAAFMAGLDHPLMTDIEAVRKMILGAAPGITEGVKWNAPSFRKSDWFATVNLRSRDAVQLVLHTGAKPKDNPEMKIPDKAGLMRWLAKDRCIVTLGKGATLRANKAAFETIVRAWLRYV